MKLFLILTFSALAVLSVWFVLPQESLHASSPAAQAAVEASPAPQAEKAPSADKTVASPQPSASGGAVPSPKASGSVIPRVPSPSPSPTPLTDRDVKDMRKEFAKAQKSQIKALEHRHQTEIKELEASHKARLNEWREKEKIARREYFKGHTKGAERRAYIKDYVERQQMFMNGMREERDRRKAEQQARRGSLVEQQTDSRKRFDEVLEKRERPPQSLWPQPGM